MIKNLFVWTKNNKLATLLIFALLFFILTKEFPRFVTRYRIAGSAPYEYGYDDYGGRGGGYPIGYKAGIGKASPIMPPIYGGAAPTLDEQARKVITDAYISLQVANVSDAVKDIKKDTPAFGGYIVNIQIDRPEFGENASISVRLPADKTEEFLSRVKQTAIKVVSETMSGNDVTDQYVDTQTRLAQLEEQKTTLLNILKSAKTVDEIMKVQPYIDSVQSQIDALKGQNKYIDESSKSTLVTMYLSTDELSLPYTPDKSWRPEVVFKNAMRSLLVNMQKAGTGLIWLGVYSILIVPALTIAWIVYKVATRKRS